MIRRDYFVFGGVKSLDYDVWFGDAHTEDTPPKDVSTESIAGRNGDLLNDMKRWKNVDVVYSAAIIHDFSNKYEALISALASRSGYQRLEDSVRPLEYRLAVFRDAVQPKNTPYNRAGQFDLLFHCKPQRFLKSGDRKIELSAAGALYNPTAFPAKPLIAVYGTAAGTLTVGDYTVEVKSITDKIILDCEIQDAYLDGANLNRCVRAPEFPELVPGKNEISWTGGITGVDIIPRWWTL